MWTTVTVELSQISCVAGDGQVMVWDTRYEAIANDELRHI
eukprot:gene54526-72865_t